MNKRSSLFLLIATLVVSCTATTQAGRHVIRQFPMDANLVYEVRVPFERGVTTISFPSPISDLAGANIALEGASNSSSNSPQSADFVLSFSPGAYYFKIKANHADASGMLNVIHGRQTYLIRLTASEKPFYSINFYKESGSAGHSIAGSGQVDHTMMLGFLDKAKAYHLLKKDHGEAFVGTDHKIFNDVMHYDGFQVHLEEGWRFRTHDVIVFRATLINRSSEPIEYMPSRLAARAGFEIHYQKVAHASGVMPPGSASPIFFAIKGKPDGSRSNLTLNNNWNILVPRKKPLVVIETAAATGYSAPKRPFTDVVDDSKSIVD